MIASYQFSVDGTALKLVSASQTAKVVIIHNVGNGSVYMNGTSAVSSSTGFYIDKAAGPLQIQLASGDELWGISASGTHTVTVLEVKQ
jgi:hypothetical protein